jgi:glyoxylase-like metal-dependent hydrolase (beta-lactamase superfamily II)
MRWREAAGCGDLPPDGEVLCPPLDRPPRKVDRVLREGKEVAGFRVIHAPGHAPGEVTFWRDSDRVAS